MRPDESFVEQPIRSLQTMLRVISEDDTQYLTVVPDGIYGPSTTQAVTVFQRQNDLPTTGIVDQTTWDRIYDVYETALVRIGKAEPIEILIEPGENYKLGDSSPHIYLLQSILTQLSLDHPDITTPTHTGVLDDDTVQSLLGFQRLTDLEQTGELDLITWKHLSRHFSLNAHHNNRKKKNSAKP